MRRFIVDKARSISVFLVLVAVMIYQGFCLGEVYANGMIADEDDINAHQEVDSYEDQDDYYCEPMVSEEAISNDYMTIKGSTPVSSTIWFEGFEESVVPNLPSNWGVKIINGTEGKWQVNKGTKHPSGINALSGDYVAYFNSFSAASGESVILYNKDIVDLTHINSPEVSYYVYRDNQLSSENDYVRIVISKDGGNNWSFVGSTIKRYSSSNGWYSYTTSLSNYSDEKILIGFYGYSDYGNDIHIDNIRVSGVFPGNAKPKMPLGEGTEENPYLISSAENLSWITINNQTYDGFLNMYFLQTSDIDLEGEWVPIGDGEVFFSGTYDGGWNSINGIAIDNSDQYLGLFGCNRGTIENLDIDVNIVGSNSYGYVGGLVGYNRGLIKKVSINGHIESSGSNAPVGGVVGQNNGLISSCNDSSSCSAKITSIGSIAGLNYENGFVLNCTSYSGGIVGYNKGSIANCSILSGKSYGGRYFGGITRENEGLINNCYLRNVTLGESDQTGSIYGVGAITGINHENGEIYNCFESNTLIYTTSVTYPGALVGKNYGRIENAYYTQSIGSYGMGYLASGAVNYRPIYISDKSIFTDKAFFEESSNWNSTFIWDFVDVWDMKSTVNNGYPYIKCQSNLIENNGFYSLSNENYFIKIFDKNTNNPVSSAEVTLGNEIKESSKTGYVNFQNIDNSKVLLKVSAPNYQHFIGNILINEGSRSMTVYLDQLDQNNGPYISSVLMTVGNQQYDILNSAYNFIKKTNDHTYEGEMCRIDVRAVWKGLKPKKYYLSQGGGKSISSDNGVFNNVNIGKTFDGGQKAIFVYAESEDGVLTKLCDTRLSVKTAESGQWWAATGGSPSFNLTAGGKNGFTVPQGQGGIFENMKLEFPISGIPISCEIDEKKVKVVIGTSIKTDPKTGKWLNSTFSYERYKSDFKNYMDQASWAARKQNRSLKQLRHDYNLSNKSLWNPKNFGGGFEVLGYVEYAITDHGLDFIEGQMGLEFEKTYLYQGQMFIGTVPVYYEFGGGVGGGLQGKIVDALSDNEFFPQFEATLQAKISAELGAGVGIAKVAGIGIKGRGSLVYTVEFEKDKYTFDYDINHRADFTCNATFEVRALGFVIASKEFASYSKPLFNEKLYGSQNNGSEKLQETIENAFLAKDYALTAQAESRDYLAMDSEWLELDDQGINEKTAKSVTMNQSNSAALIEYVTIKDDVLYNDMDTAGYKVENNNTIKGDSQFETKEFDVLKTNIYPMAEPIISKMGDEIAMVWIDDHRGRTVDINKTMLVYSVYNEENDSWSTPMAISDDGMPDFNPSVCDGYVVWQKGNKIFEETDTLEEVAKYSEIYMAEWSEGSFLVPVRLTNNEILDMVPEINLNTDDSIDVVWLRNSANDILGLERNTVVVKKTKRDVWQSLENLMASSQPIIDYSVGYDNGEICVAYIIDQDNDFNTFDDHHLYLYKNGNKSLVSNQDINPAYPTFIDRNGNTELYWYTGDNIAYKENIGIADIQYVFSAPMSMNNSFTVMPRGTDYTSIVWIGADDDHAEVYGGFYNGTTWGEPVVLSETNARVLSVSGMMDESGVIRTVMNRNVESVVGSNIYNTSDLCTLKITPSYDLRVQEVYINDKEMIINEYNQMAVVIENKGELDVDGYQITLRDNNGENSTWTYNEVLKSGQMVEVNPSYLYEDVDSSYIFVQVKPLIGTDSDLSGNSMLYRFGYADVSVSDVQVIYSDYKANVYVTVHNDSYKMADHLKVLIRDGSENGEILGQCKLYSLASDKKRVASFEIDSSIINFDEDYKTLYITISCDDEIYRGNNVDYVLLDNNQMINIVKNADCNDDGIVDVMDYVLFLKDYNEGVYKGVLDFNLDHCVDQIDFKILLDAFGMQF